MLAKSSMYKVSFSLSFRNTERYPLTTSLPVEKVKLILISSVVFLLAIKQVLQNGLGLLGVSAPEKCKIKQRRISFVLGYLRMIL
jgi:hypothetical protein